MTKVHHKTRKAADISLAKRKISPASYRAVLAGEITLQAARDLGWDKGPDDTSDADDGLRQASEQPREGRTPRPCLCSCGGMTKGGRFLPGHDARLRSELVAQIKKGDVLLRSDRITPEQRAFAVRHGLIAKETLPEEESDG
jgi:hypothetical protein